MISSVIELPERDFTAQKETTRTLPKPTAPNELTWSAPVVRLAPVGTQSGDPDAVLNAVAYSVVRVLSRCRRAPR